MSSQAVRKLSSLIPPKIAASSAVGSGSAPKSLDRFIRLYQRLPRGPPPLATPKTFGERYYQKYIATNSSKPLVHLILFFLTAGYSFDYYFHLRHEH